ncbi:MAG: succinate--CoA ligase subunit beta [Deltaproteobacteria bacterium RIFCSPLOWO2_12_FULL_40_28]|nr:MAG: succinate--CoA ligase subunit beta [Deltaproteobacteria bacterium RIFCSPHIGHO2_02_FULL_40_28]OGQ18839.1 MAG: succinate--CoA ligase subunit beta [Deltaproteobacteria bacterium RIFCSPHIGHO2_12_FULL_40_32]OGQ40084.1 MAG: succinate--CoA ligase subunit beta [Deltaproteobacteria bacterium RIFCSPLOWO2_02_FULL_40_36]OGQ53267.1 MAG: succinate--CoA ligase subunit beta [Deltaproteobacteria bacterium RIFCSPLOWO2_12_FULL_40_28]
MNIHEYQAKEILSKYGVPIPKGRVATSVDEALKIAQELGFPVVVKSQIHAGGRGKGTVYKKNTEGNLLGQEREVVMQGGVKVVKTEAELMDFATKLLENILVTHQSGAEGKKIKKILIEQGIKIKKEYYLGAVLDRATSRVTLMASTEGGVEIEEVAAKHPEKIIKVAIDPACGFMPYQGRHLGFALGLNAEATSKLVKFAGGLAKAFVEADCALVEINPLVLTEEGELLAVDAKLNFEDNALFRHKEYEALRDLDEENLGEIEAKKHDLSYISLDGNIGCMVNGAGLAMATMDIIKLYGGEPANFLDVGGGANQEKVSTAFKIILTDPKVKAILVNIFGGIMKCDVIAEGVVAAAREMGLKIPLVVRLQGTNVDLGKKILAGSGLKIIPADTMADAAEKVVGALM